MSWYVRVQRDPWQMQEKLYIAQIDKISRHAAVVTNLVLETTEYEGAFPDKPVLGASLIYGGDENDVRGFLKACMDAAWELGIKPSAFEEPTQELKATKYHLEDMRQLAGVKKDEK